MVVSAAAAAATMYEKWQQNATNNTNTSNKCFLRFTNKTVYRTVGHYTILVRFFPLLLLLFCLSLAIFRYIVHDIQFREYQIYNKPIHFGV